MSSVQAAGLVVPESMVLSQDNTLDLLESLFFTVRFGIRQCWDDNSFEAYRVASPFGCTTDEGDTSLSMAKPSYWPTDVSSVDAVLDELDLLLTSKRLGPKNRALIKSIVEPVFSSGDIARAVRMSQQLTLASPGKCLSTLNCCLLYYYCDTSLMYIHRVPFHGSDSQYKRAERIIWLRDNSSRSIQSSCHIEHDRR